MIRYRTRGLLVCAALAVLLVVPGVAATPGRTLDPALVYSADGWSLVHSIYDAPVQIGPGGELEMVAAESMVQVDPLTWEIRLRPDITFHNGEPLESSSITFSVAHIVDPATASQVAGNFAVIEEVDALAAALDAAVERHGEFAEAQRRYVSETFELPDGGEASAARGADAIVDFLRRVA